MRLIVNPFSSRGPYTQEERLITSCAAAAAARQQISAWANYSRTPVRTLPAFAADMRVQEVWLKDESTRLDQGSFKALGGAYATAMKLQEMNVTGPVTVCCATEGNHGRSVAFAAKRLNCRAVIYMSEQSLDYKADAIKALGAEVIRAGATFDEAARLAQRAADEQGWVLIADTNAENDRTVHRVMQGYGVMALELLEQFSGRDFPTHIFIQAGVGGLAAGVIGVLSEALGEDRPKFIIVEPQSAACLFESCTRFEPACVAGELQTRMRMLAVGEASPAAWPVLQRRVDAFMAIDDEPALRTVERLNAPEAGREALNIGLTGAASLAGAMELARRQHVAAMLGMNESSRVLAFGTEAGRPTVDVARNA